jgi:hypothetical protein
MHHIDCANLRERWAGPPSGCAMISGSLGHREKCFSQLPKARPRIPTMADYRFKIPRCALLVLLVVIGIPSAAFSSTLEDSTKEFARKIGAAIPAGQEVSCEVRNISSLPLGDVARIEQALKAGLQEQGMRLTSGGAEIALVVTLSENFKGLIWTGEIHKGETSQIVLISVERSSDNRGVSGTTPVTIHSEKFWEGPEHILDAGEISDGAGKSWLVLLLPQELRIQDRQSGTASTIDLTSNQNVDRDPTGKIDFGQIGNTIAFARSRVCMVDLATRNLIECLPANGSSDGPAPSRYPLMIDLAPEGPPPPGKGIELMIRSVCGGLNQFLATRAGDYTQTDSLQLYQTESNVPAPVSTELEFPGPIINLHSALDIPRAIVRNLKTGNYEAYRLSFSCAQ